MVREDKDIVAECLSGNKQAFEQLVEKYSRRMYAVAYRFMRNQEDSRDVVQESFVAAYSALDRYDPSRKFVTWLLAITTNQALYRLRQRKKRDTTSVPLEEDRVTSGFTPEQEYEQKQQRKNIDTALASLSSSYRAVLVMRHFENLSYEKIAEVLNIPIGTVKTNIFRARRMFANKLSRLEGSFA